MEVRELPGTTLKTNYSAFPKEIRETFIVLEKRSPRMLWTVISVDVNLFNDSYIRSTFSCFRKMLFSVSIIMITEAEFFKILKQIKDFQMVCCRTKYMKEKGML